MCTCVLHIHTHAYAYLHKQRERERERERERKRKRNNNSVTESLRSRTMGAANARADMAYMHFPQSKPWDAISSFGC